MILSRRWIVFRHGIVEKITSASRLVAIETQSFYSAALE